MRKAINVFVVDDHQLMIEGVSTMLQNGEFRVVGYAKSAEKCLEALSRVEVDVLVCDLQMPGRSGMELIKEVKKRFPTIRIAVLSMCDESAIVAEVVALGVNAYMLKNIDREKLITALERVIMDKFFISEEIGCVLMGIKGKELTARKVLTKREEEVLGLLLSECPNKVIADKLCISERTVEVHRRNIYQKTGTTSIVGLIRWAMEHSIGDRKVA